MKSNSLQPVLQRLQEIIERDTGRPLSATARVAVEALLNELRALGAGGSHRREFLSHDVTILFADLRGFTAMLANQPAGIVVQTLDFCLIRMSEIIFKHQGTIDKFMGDSIMVLFGAPVQRPDDARHALACAVEMQLTMDALNRSHKPKGMPELSMGIGINTGNVLAGTLGSDLYSEYTVIGDDVNLASRIEAFSLRGQVLIGQSTYERCRDFVETRPPIDIHVKGRPQPVRVHELVGIPSLGIQVPRKEARRSHRIEARLPFSYKSIDKGVVLPETHQGVILDLGYHGALLEFDSELPAYSEIKMRFDLPMVGYLVENAYAKILPREPNDSTTRMGAEFTSLPPEADAKVRQFVQFLVFANQLP